MIKLAVALRYSKALFDQDLAKGDLEKRLNDFDSLLELLKSYPKLMKFLGAPQIDLQEKEKTFKACVADKFDSTFFHFLFYLIRKGRLSYLTQIALEYRLMVNEYLGIWEAQIFTAVPISEDIEKILKEKLENFYRKKMNIKKEVDSKMIGGAILVVANEMIDWSVRGRLKKLKEHLLAISV